MRNSESLRSERNIEDDAGVEAWDMSEFLEKPNIEQEVETWSNEYRATELQFAKYQKGFSGSKLDGAYRKSVLAYEDDLAHDFGLLDEATQAAWSEGVVTNSYEMAQRQNLDAVEPSETIEAASGIFFTERMGAIFGRIGENANEEEGAGDRAFAQQTWQKVLGYIEAAGDYELMHGDYAAYQRKRQGAHNAMIRQLNGLNELAEKYGCKRLTVRNFMTNDFVYRQKLDTGRYLDRRANYDRETVLAYFQTVYASDFEKAAVKNSREIEWY